MAESEKRSAAARKTARADGAAARERESCAPESGKTAEKSGGTARRSEKAARGSAATARESGGPEPDGAHELTRADVARRLLELYERCLRSERVMTYDKDEKRWVMSDEWKVDARGAAMALGQLSGLMGFGAPEKGAKGAELRLSEEAAELAE